MTELPAENPAVTPLTKPSNPASVVDSGSGLARVVAAFLGGTGPIAADCERASGYRYGQATYLVQLRRAGAGTALIDPTLLPNLSAIMDAVGDEEFVLHAASQDLPGLADHGIRPARIFDTELAARLLGMERVGLAAVVSDVLGLGLAKEHSAVDWSTRPLPEDWLLYAALDVEVLIELRDALAQRLQAAGKADWAAQEFEYLRTAPPPPPKPDPWRKVTGTSALRDQRRMAVVKALWEARDYSARSRDIAPGRVLPDRAILAAATALPRNTGQLIQLPEFAGKGQRRRATQWQRAIDKAMRLPEDLLPPLRGPGTEGPPQPRMWIDRNPEAAERLAAAKEFMAASAAELAVPVENLLQPDALRRLCWTPPVKITPDTVGEALAERNAREWQMTLLAAPLAKVLNAVT